MSPLALTLRLIIGFTGFEVIAGAKKVICGGGTNPASNPNGGGSTLFVL
jgi:hypothetical protein